MSAQFGRWNFDGRPLDSRYLRKVASLLTPYGPDHQNAHVAGNIALQYFAFYTTKESHYEIQPHLSMSGDVITWDGLLDNREDVARELGRSSDGTDLSIVEAAWTHWGTAAFPKLIGDWALAIWRPSQQTLYLAKDFVGTRHLYYHVRPDHAVWSTVLDPLVVLAGRSFQLDEEYLAGWLSHFAAPHLTPFAGIHAVPPAGYVQIQHGKAHSSKYWEFDHRYTISYPRDRDYEEHFLSLLKTSVRRRLRSDGPVLAELSGGVDSSSIVCVADALVASGLGSTNRIDTVSFYQDGEPAWDERPYIAVIERTRGHAGYHIDVSDHTLLAYDYDPDHPELTPVSRGGSSVAVGKLASHIKTNGYRIVLSGLAGDELLGGVPGFVPQLADLLVSARIPTLLSQLRAWALSNRTTFFALLREIMHAFSAKSVTPGGVRSAPWWEPAFISEHLAAFSRYERPFSVVGTRPSYQERLETIDAIRRQIASSVVAPQLLCERRYPYLDRDLVEFLVAIPPDQLQRPGQRRSLMRRALIGIVPEELLNRKRKAFIARQPLVDIMSHWSAYRELTENPILGALHIIDRDRLIGSLEQARAGNIIALPLLAHAVVLEKWLRHIRPYGLISSLPENAPSASNQAAIQSQLRTLAHERR